MTAGSNGAQDFNETMPKIVVALLEAVPGLTIVHQAGRGRLERRGRSLRRVARPGAVAG